MGVVKGMVWRAYKVMHFPRQKLSIWSRDPDVANSCIGKCAIGSLDERVLTCKPAKASDDLATT